MENVIGIDIGGTKTLIGLSMGKDQVTTRQFQTVFGDFETFLVSLRENIARVLEEGNYEFSDFKSIGISCPGLLEIDKGVVVAAINLGWINIELVKAIQNITGVEEVVLEGDTRCGLIAEFHARGGRYQSMTYLTASTGIGCAMMFDGKIFRGAHNFAGEVGQSLTRDGMRLEEIASGRFLLDFGSTPENVLSAGNALGECIYNLFQIIDTEVCVIGGGLGLNNHEYFHAVQKFLSTCEQRSPSGRKYPVEKSIYGTLAPLMGSLLVAHQKQQIKL